MFNLFLIYFIWPFSRVDELQNLLIDFMTENKDVFRPLSEISLT